MTERYGVRPDAEGWAPLLCDCLCETGDTGFGQCVVCLACVAVEAGCGGDVDNGAWFAILDTEIWCGGSYKLEGLGVVESNDGVPLLVGRLPRLLALFYGLCARYVLLVLTLWITPSHV